LYTLSQGQYYSFYWGQAPKPPWFRFAESSGPYVFCEAEQTLFASFSGKRRVLLEYTITETMQYWLFLGASPQTPVVPLRGRFGSLSLLRSRTNARKRRVLLEYTITETINALLVFFGGKPPNPRGSASRKVWVPKSSAKQNKRFLLFSGKRRIVLEYTITEIMHYSFLLGASPQTPVVPLRGRFGSLSLLRSRTNAFCFFFWKKKSSGKQ
jgi:hypothetical protein